MIKKITPTLLAGLCVLLLSPFAYADRAEDREAINELMWHYARALDTFNPDAYAAVFTEDGQFGSGNMGSKGRDNLWKMVEDLRVGREKRAAEGNPAAPMFHMNTDVWIEFIDETHALHHTYWLTMYGANGDSPAGVAAAGRGVDQLVKVDGQWLIHVRDVAPQD